MGSAKVYIGNLPGGIQEREIEEPFSRFGPLAHVWVARKPPGFAFIEFRDPRDAHDAVKKLDGYKGWRVEISSGKRKDVRSDRAISPPRSPVERSRRGSPSYDRRRRSRSPPPRARSPPRRRSRSPALKRRRSPSPGRRRASPSPTRRRSRTPDAHRRRSGSADGRGNGHAGDRNGDRAQQQRSRSPARGRSRDRSASPARSASPVAHSPVAHSPLQELSSPGSPL